MDNTNTWDVPDNENYKATVQIQEREARYGEGTTKRGIEFEIAEGVKVGFSFGDIAESVTEAVMCPTTPWLELGGGAVEWAIAEAAGLDLFNKDAQMMMDSLRGIHSSETFQEQLVHAQAIQSLLGLEEQYTTEAIVSQSLTLTTVAVGKLALKFGSSVPIGSGKLAERGIEKIVLTNVTPDQGGMTISDMALFTQNSINAARLAQVKSVTIPAVGTGFAAAFGFGLPLHDSIKGFLRGCELAIQNLGGKSDIERIDYNLYALPTYEVVSGFAKKVLQDSVGGFEFIYSLGE